jgi:hypothetical protein
MHGRCARDAHALTPLGRCGKTVVTAGCLARSRTAHGRLEVGVTDPRRFRLVLFDERRYGVAVTRLAIYGPPFARELKNTSSGFRFSLGLTHLRQCDLQVIDGQ